MTRSRSLERSPRRVVLGLGGTVDYEISWDRRVVDGLIEQYGIREPELSTSIPIESERDLLVSLLGFLVDGVGGERFVASPEIIAGFAARFDTRVTLGGTCVRAGLAMRVLGVPCTLHLNSIDDNVRRLLPAECSYICSAVEDTTYPHLIVQFPEGTGVRISGREVTVSHPNRVIFVNDPPHVQMVLSDELPTVLTDAGAFLVSGLNVMQDESLLRQRLRELIGHMRALPDDAVVVYEDAGFHVPALSVIARDAIASVADVYGMNEDELQAYLGVQLDLLDVEEMAGALARLRELVPGPTLVVHTKHWSLAMGEESRAYEAALRGGIALAAARYLHGDVMTRDEVAGMSRYPLSPTGEEFARRIEARMPTVRCIPGFRIDTPDPTTIGLGDTFVGGFIAALH